VAQRLVVRDLSATPARWRADRTAQAYVKELHGFGAEVRAIEELDAIDDAYKSMAVAFAASGVGVLLELGGSAAAAGYAVLAGDAVDAAIFGAEGISRYLEGESRYEYALGATPTLGSDNFLAEADAARESGLMTLVGVIAPGVGGVTGFRQIRRAEAIERGKGLLRTRSLDELTSDQDLADAAAYFMDLRLKGAGKLDAADQRALAEFDKRFAKAGKIGPGTSALPKPDLPDSRLRGSSSNPSSSSSGEPFYINLDSDDLANLDGGPWFGSSSNGAGLNSPKDLPAPKSAVEGDSSARTVLTTDPEYVKLAHGDRLSKNDWLKENGTATVRDPQYHLAPNYQRTIRPLDVEGDVWEIDGEVYRRGSLRNPVPDQPGSNNGTFADVYSVVNENGEPMGLVAKRYGERQPWDKDANGAYRREPSLNSEKGDDLVMADDIEYGAGVLDLIGVPQAEVYHVEYGKHTTLLQREIGSNLPPGVAKEESWQKAIADVGGGNSLSPEFKPYRMALLDMEKKLSDGGGVWEDSNKGNFFYQHMKTEGDAKKIQAAVNDQDRVDYVRDFGDGRKPRPGREATAWFNQMAREWEKNANKLPFNKRPLTSVDEDAHLLNLVSLWRKGAFRVNANGEAVDGWLRVDEIREVFGDHFKRLMNEH
jgi:hypothetical protein